MHVCILIQLVSWSGGLWAACLTCSACTAFSGEMTGFAKLAPHFLALLQPISCTAKCCAGAYM